MFVIIGLETKLVASISGSFGLKLGFQKELGFLSLY